MNGFCDIHVSNGENPVFCYRSGYMVYEETLSGGALVSCGWNAAGYPLDVLQLCPTRIRPDAIAEPSVFRLDMDGICLDYSWKMEGFDRRGTDRGLEGVLSLVSQIKPVRVRLHTLLDGTQTMSRWFDVENLSDGHLCVSRLHLMSGAFETMDLKDFDTLPEPEKRYDIGWFDGFNWGTEGGFNWHPARPGVEAIDTRFGRDRYRHPLMMIRNNVMGTILYMQTAWSGGCRFTVDYNAKPLHSESVMAFSAEITGYNPLLVLRPRETFAMPEVEIGFISGGLDDAVNDMHAHTRRSVLNMPEADGSACLVGSGMGAEHDMSMSCTEAYMRQFASMGAEVFIIDAGWACPPEPSIDWGGCNGRNVPDPDRYPDNGLMKLRDLCHSLGMKFALWVEIERLGKRSPEYARHPEWRAEDRFGDRTRGYLDLTVPEAAAWAEGELERMIREYGMDLLRVDYNVSSVDYFDMKDTCGCGIRECIALRQFRAVYDMYASLKRKFPNVIFENCAGGGGRTDLGQMRAFNHTWVSDWQRPPRSVLITNGMTMALPPERVDRLFAGMGCHTAGSLAFHMRNAMLGHVSLNVIAPKDAVPAGPAMDFVRRSVALYKSFIRPFLPDAKVYHHTPETEACRRSGFCAIEIAAQDGTRGAVGAFTLAMAGSGEHVVYPKGIDPAKRYRITYDNSGSTVEMSGACMARDGLRLALPGAITSELVLYEAAGEFL
ncbi:MAG: alpha-galactosidase [Clostridia bacterium]|nr:alpha-galactosidase [Clostridia bacterium]